MNSGRPGDFTRPVPLSRSIRRIVGKRPPRRYFLIVCEGESTEPNYFDDLIRTLPNEMVKRITLEGRGQNPGRLLRYAENCVEDRLRQNKPPYYHVWLVFDRDSFAPEEFDGVIQKIEQGEQGGNGMMRGGAHWHAGWSNEAFELWYLLHFQEATGGKMSRADYQGRLSRHLGEPYEKNRKGMFLRLSPFLEEALKSAERAIAKHRDVALPKPYHEWNPATTVHLLVSELLRYREK